MTSLTVHVSCGGVMTLNVPEGYTVAHAPGQITITKEVPHKAERLDAGNPLAGDFAGNRAAEALHAHAHADPIIEDEPRPLPPVPNSAGFFRTHPNSSSKGV